MKYALISDIHGNYPALKAILEDAKKHGVQKFLFLGDYFEDFPWPNEVANTIRELESSVVIGGNKEDYLVNLHKQDKSAWIYEQMAPMYWNYRELTPNNLDYLMSLPKEAELLDDSGGVIRLCHSSPNFFRKPRIECFHSLNYSRKMRAASFTHSEYLNYTRECVYNNSELMAELEKFLNCVNAFGHNHLQWHMQVGTAMHVNPGSCGLPIDFNSDAPYTIIEYAGNNWTVTEQRVPYDVEFTINQLKLSTLYKHAEIWSEIVIEELMYAEDRITPFLLYV